MFISLLVLSTLVNKRKHRDLLYKIMPRRVVEELNQGRTVVEKFDVVCLSYPAPRATAPARPTARSRLASSKRCSVAAVRCHERTSCRHAAHTGQRGETEVRNDAARRRHDALRQSGAAVVPDPAGGRPAACVRAVQGRDTEGRRGRGRWCGSSRRRWAVPAIWRCVGGPEGGERF